MNGPNKLECYIIPGWKSTHGTNSLAFWPYAYVTKNKVLFLHYTRLERLDGDKHSKLLALFVRYEEK
jgi:hypothetical protein